MSSPFEQAAKKLLSDDIGEAHKVASDLRERIEIVHTHEFGSFLKHFFPVFQELLTKRLPPQFTDNPTNRFRQIILEIFHRLPNNEVLKPCVKSLIAILMEIILVDNENSALMCLRIMFDLHKNFRPSLESEARPLLELARHLYEDFPNNVDKVFNPLRTSKAVEGLPTGVPGGDAQAMQQPPVSTLDAYSSSRNVSQQQPSHLVRQSDDNIVHPLIDPSLSTALGCEGLDKPDAAGAASASAVGVKFLKSTESFKVLTECPLTVMLLFQLYPRHIQENVPKLVPLMIKALEVRLPPPTSDSHPDMNLRYKELISCQVKALSFLTYLLRGFSEILLEYEQIIADSVISLMNRCPQDAIATRKELLVATRHILVTDFRKGFNGKIDGLLDKSVLLGSGPEASDVLRPLAFSTLADLVHHVRKTLTLQQFATIIDMFSRNIHDCTLLITIQTTSVRLLFNLVDQTFHNTDRDPRIGKYLLIRIIISLVYKFKSLKYYIPRIQAADNIRKEKKKMQELGSTPILEGYLKVLQDSKEVSKERENSSSEVSPPPSTPSSLLNESEDVPSNHEGGVDHQPSSSHLVSSEVDKCAMKELMIPSCTVLEPWNPPGTPRKQMLGGPETDVDSVKELKSLVKTMIVGLKTVIWCCNNYHRPRTTGGEQKRQDDQRHPQPAIIMPEVERDLVSKAFKWALECLLISMECSGGISPDGKDLLDHFAGAFTVLESYNFRMIVGPHIPLLFEILQSNPALLNIPQYLLANLNTSATMVDILLCFLVQQMDDLAGYDPAGRRFVEVMNDLPGRKVGTAGMTTCDVSCAANVGNEGVRYSTAAVFGTHGVNVPNAPNTTATERATDATYGESSSSEEKKHADQRAVILLRLFKAVFGSVALFPKNEMVLRPHLQMLILSCLRYITRVSNPIHYLNLLRTLFRSISGGKFEQSYKEILPLLPLLLTELSELQKRSTEPVIRNLLVELCLTVPARLASLLPHLLLMMRLIVRALTCESDLEGLALRTLEFWVDNLNPIYLYRMMSHDPQVLVDVMSALCNNLRPTPFPYGMSTLRLLGKIGGRCRHFIRLPMPIPQGNIDVVGAISCFQANVNWPKGGGNTERAGGRREAERIDVTGEESSESAVERDTPSQSTTPLNLDSIILAACRLMDDLSIKIKEKDLSPLLSLSRKPPSPPHYSDYVHSTVSKQVDELQNFLNSNQSSAFRFLVRCLSEVAGLDVAPISCDEIRHFVAPECNSMNIGMELAKKRYEEIRQELDVEVDSQLEEQKLQKSNVVKQMLQAIILSASCPNLNQEAVNVLRGLILNLMRITTPVQLDHTLFADISKIPPAPFDPFNDKKGFALDPPLNEPFSPLRSISEYLQEKQIVTPQELTEAMVSMLTYDAKEEVQRVVLDCIRFVVSSSGVAAGSGRSGEGQMGRVVLHSLVVLLCSACFDMDWSKKIGASRGIRVVCECMSWQAVRVFELRIMEALLYVMRDIPREKTVAMMEHTEMALVALLKTRYGDEFILNPNLNMGRGGGDATMVDANATNLSNVEKKKAAADDAAERNAGDEKYEAGRRVVCQLVVRLLAIELTSFHHKIRRLVKWVLQVLSVVSKKSVAELLLPCKVNLHRRMFGKPLRSLQAFVQIGILELLAYLFSLRSNDILPIDEPVLSILQDMMIVLDQSSWSTPADGGAPSLHSTLSRSGGLPITPRGCTRGCLERLFPFDTRNTARDTGNALELPSSLQFQVSSIHVMRTAIVNHGNIFSESGPQNNLWHRFMNMIFHFVAGGSEHVVDTACMALVDLMSTLVGGGGGGQVSFKPEWKRSLEPLLKKLGSLSTLSLELFDELSRLLCLLPGWLGPTLGDKLLEYLMYFKEPETIINLSDPKGWQAGEEAHVAAGLLNLFYQLPLGEAKFMESLVTVTIQLEEVLPCYQLMNCNESPFLLPLVKYLSRFPVASINFFLSRKCVSLSSFSSLFLRAIESREGTELRNILSANFVSFDIFFACFLDVIKHVMENLGNSMVTSGVEPIANALSQFEMVAGNGGIYVNGQVSERYKAAEFSLVKVLQLPLIDTTLLAKMLTPKSQRLKLIPPWQLPNLGSAIVGVQLFGLSLVHAAIKLKPGYLTDCPVIGVTIRHLWRQVVLQGPELRHELDDPHETRHINIVKELMLLLKCLLLIYESDPSNIDVLLEILVVFITPDLHLVDLTFVLHFFRYRVHALTSNTQKKSLFTMSMSMICDPQWNEEAKIQCLKVLIIPCLTEAFMDPKVSNLEIVDPPLISQFVKEVLATVMPSTRTVSSSASMDATVNAGGKEGVNLSEERRLGPGDLKGEVSITSLPSSQSNRHGGWSCSEFLRIELLRLGTLMIEFLSAIMVDHRRELIKFAWNHLRAEDSISKQWAYINVCQFISVYDTPSKIILQVYVALLRIHQPEVKHLVQTALDILVPSIPRRLIYSDFVKAIKWTKKIMYEDGYALAQLIHMWQLVIRHPVLFYTYRSQFIPQMVNSLNRLGLPPNCPLENRQLAFALVDIMVGWEVHHKQRVAAGLCVTSINNNQQPRGIKRPANGGGSSSSTTKMVKTNETAEDKMMVPTAKSSLAVATTLGAVASRSAVSDAAAATATEQPPSAATEPPPFSSGQSTYFAPAPQGGGGNEATTDIAALSAAQLRDGFQQEDSFCLSAQMVEMILNFLVRMTLLAAGSRELEMVELSKQCLGLMSQVLKTWPKTIFVKYVYFEKHLHTPIEHALQQQQGSGASSSTSVLPNTSKNVSGSPRHAYMDKHMKVHTGQGQQPKGPETSSSSLLANLAKHSAGNASIKDPKNLNLMETGLKVIIMLIEDGHPEFLEVNAGSLAILLPWYFMCHVPRIKEELKTFCLLILKLFPPLKANLPKGLVNFHTALKYTIEQRIFLAVSLKPAVLETKAAFSASQARGGSYRNAPTAADIAEPAQSILAAIIKERQEYAVSNATKLVKLLQRLAQDHIAAAAKKSKAQLPVPHGLGEVFQIAVLSQTMPTPIIGILQAALAGVQILEKVEEISALPTRNMLDTICSCLRILSSHITSGTISREDFEPCMQIVGALLDKSTNIPLLNVLVEIVTEWLLSTSVSFTDKDRISLFGKLSRFERLPEIHIIHLQDLYHNLLFQLYTGFELYEPGTADEPVGADKPVMGKKAAKWLALGANTAFVAGMMSARPATRKCFVDAFCAAAPGSSMYDLLLFIFKQDWSSLGARFWPCVIVDIFLMRALRDGDSSPIRPFIHLRKLPPLAGQVSPVMTKDEQMIMSACYVSLHHGCSSGNKIEGGKISSLIDSLQGIVHADVFLAEKVLLEILPLAWKSLDETERSYCLPAMVSVLSQSSQRPNLHQPPSKAMSLKHYVNSPQSLLRAISAMRPLPVLPPDVLGWLAEQYNAWHEALPIVEYQAMTSSPPIRQEWIQALCRMYSKLGEQDMCSAVVRMSALNPDTRVAVSMETYGFITQAQTLYYDCMVAELGETGSADGNSTLQKVGNGGIPGQSPQLGSSKNGTSAMELNAWEERWIECVAGLCQWNVLEEFSTSLQYPDLLLESSWKSHDWDVVRQCMSSPTVVAGRESWSPALKLYDIYLAIIDGKMSDVEKLCTKCVQLVLHQWQLLPRIHSGDSAHKSLFHIFHQLVELRESSHVVEVSRPDDQQTLPDFKSILATWRERRPNRWDKLRQWDDIFCWRMEVFMIIMNTFKFSDPGALACLHDNSWTVIKRAHVARKQGLYEICLNSLRKLYAVATMDVQDAFEKLREQIILCLSNSSEEHGGLNIINNTNLDYFNAQQKAELFRLKGMFLSKLGAGQDANHAYSHAMQICGDYGKGWLSWAKYCDSIYAEQADVQAAGQAIACYLQAISHGCNWAKMTMARVLWILSQDDENGHLGKTLENYGKGISEWVWIPWIPQLLTALTRPEAKHIKAFIRPMAIRYPQALYYTMRAFLLEMRELPRSNAKSPVPPVSPKREKVASNRGAGETTKSSTVTAPSGASGVMPAGSPISTVKALASGNITSLPPPQPPTAGSIAAPPSKTFSQPSVPPRQMLNGAQHSEELMSVMRRANLGLAAQMEGILEETILHFRSEPAEELLSAVCSLSLKCFQLLSARQSDEAPSSLRFTLTRVCNKFFKATQNSGRPSHRAFAQRFKEDFERDFHIDEYSQTQAQQQQPETEGAERPPSARKDVPTLTEVVLCLKKWKRLLQVVVSSVPSKTPLRHSSAYLARLQGEVETWNSGNLACVEIPGQYIKSFEESKPELHAMLLRFDGQVVVRQKQGATTRCLGMLASNGHTYYFSVMFAIPQTTRTDERMVQLHTVVEELLGKHVQARRRDLIIHTPSVIPITPRMRLIEYSLSYVSLGEVYEASCRRSRRDPDEPVIHCQQAINQKLQKAAGGGPLDAVTQSNIECTVKYKIYTETCANLVKSDLLYEFVVGLMDDAEAIWAFKRTFAQQLGVSSLLCYALAGAERFPHRIVFDCKTAHVISYELCPGYTTQGYMEPTEPVPFRLTRNLTKLLAPFHVDGVMVPAIVSLAQSLMDKVELFRPYLSLVLRDDLLSYYSSKSKSGPPSELEQRNLEKQLSDRISKNVSNLLRRIESVTPKLDDRNSSGQLIPCDSKVYALIDAASCEGNLVRMTPTWHPWL